MKAVRIAGIVLFVIGIVLFAYEQIVINSALPEYNYSNYAGFRFPIWYNIIGSQLTVWGFLLMIVRIRKEPKIPS
jgi:hypothetical protein